MATLLETVHEGIASAVEQTAPNPLGLTSFFARQPATGTRYINMDKGFSRARTASFVNPKAVADGTEKLSFSREPFMLPTIQDMQSINGEDLEAFGIGEWDNANERSLDRVDRRIAKIHEDQRRMVDAKVGLSAIEVAFEGKLTVVGKGENRVLDFGRDESLKIDVGAVDEAEYWTSPTSDKAKHIEDALETMGGFGMTGDVMVGRHATIRNFIRDENIMKTLDNRRIEKGNFIFDSMLATQGMVYHGEYIGVKIFSFDGSYQKQDGTQEKAVPSNKVVIIASNNNNIIQPAVTPILTKGNVAIDSEEFMTVVTQEKRNVDIEAMQTIAPLEAGVGSFCTLTVEA